MLSLLGKVAYLKIWCVTRHYMTAAIEPSHRMGVLRLGFVFAKVGVKNMCRGKLCLTEELSLYTRGTPVMWHLSVLVYGAWCRPGFLSSFDFTTMKNHLFTNNQP